MFGYNDRMTLDSYVPKINKSVLLISSLHNEGFIDQNDNEKKVNKWPTNMFMYMIDVAVI